MKTVVVGDAGGATSFIPYLGMISSLMGGGDKSGAKPDANAQMMQQMALMQKQQAERDAAAAKRTQTYVFAGLGVAALGTILFLALRR
jgi:hypothetical protein